MSAIQETRIDGNVDDIEAIARFMKSKVSGGAETWSVDIRSARTKTLDGWSGDAADAFETVITGADSSIESFREQTASVASAMFVLADALRTAQSSMSTVRSAAESGNLTVTGTQIHQPTAPPLSTPTPMPSGEDPREADTLADAYASQVQTWNCCVTDAASANEGWRNALETFASVWSSSGANMITLLSGLLTGGVTGSALANSAFALKSTKLINAERFASLTRTLADAAPDGKVVIPKTSYYQLLDDAGDAAKAVSAAQKALAGSADDLMEGVKAGSKLSKGLFIVGVLGTGYGIYDDMQNGESGTQAVTSNVGGMAAGMGASVVTGLAVGAAVGSFIAPPAGTIAGVVVGAVVGGVTGVFTSGLIDHLFEGAADGIGGAIEAGWNEVTDTVGAIGDGIGAIGEGIGDTWNSIFG